MCTEPWSILSNLSHSFPKVDKTRSGLLGPVCKENSGFIQGLYSGSLGDLLSKILDKEVTIRCVSAVSIKKKGKKRIEVCKLTRGKKGKAGTEWGQQRWKKVGKSHDIWE